jgi:DNA mismatch repair protein MutS2
MSLTELFRSNIDGIREAAKVLTELDLLQAQALLSSEFACTRPRMSDGLRLSLCEARHILLEDNLRKSGASAVPISLELDERNRVLVVSGPNAGGKTVVLKTVGLISLMAQMGLHVPAADAELPIFDRVFADIGDQQSIAANLSTFTAHMRNVSQMARFVAPPALVLVDEVGTGTDPDEGAALAIAIVDYFRRAGAVTIATTHYNQLKMWASSAPGVINASVEFDERTLRPTYRLILGIAGASSGLYIAERMNVPEAIVAQSRALLDPRHIEAGDYLKQIKAKAEGIEELRRILDGERAELNKKRIELEHDFAHREEARRVEFEKTLAGIADEFRRESGRLISSLQDRILAERMRKAASQRSLSLHRKGSELRERARAGIAAGSGGAGDAPIVRLYEPREGDRVKVTSLDKQGTVESVHDGTYTVVVGPLRFRARRDELEPAPTAPPAQASKPSRPAPVVPVDSEEEFVREINVIGMTADEATERVDKFIDAAFFAGVESVRIIHGHGKGVLRRAIAQLLTGHQQVQSFQPAPPNQGGSGATVVELRK